ncbi:MAG: M1 family metallopeptidase, partial [Phycisphaerae bacterium]|nr:M1 family metallopeptidase [Gemmatimonadaceae bacterium]
RVNVKDSTISGYNGIAYRVLQPSQQMQIDLQQPMIVDSILQDNQRVTVRRDTNTIFATLAAPQKAGDVKTITVYFHGRPAAAKNPPWDGGFIWRKDKAGNAFVSTANEGIGASLWWPLKDFSADEVDSQRVAITVPEPMVNVSNGRLISTKKDGQGNTTFEYFVKEPINAYGISVNAGTYAHFSETYKGEAGNLTMDFYPLAENLEVAKTQFAQAKPMMACFEKWFGPYPWYKDGFKLIEAPYLGMEHQSAVTYGNGYRNGYRGTDLSGTGRGLKWDFIIIHESAHEWWANSLTNEDPADMWIHESFANYSEGLYTECQEGKAAGAEYVIGTRKKITNDEPIIGSYGVNKTGSGDMYYKGGNMLHTIRQVINDDEKWRGILRGLQSKFRHQTVSGAQVQEYMSRQAGTDLSPIFSQYLMTTRVPIFEYKRDRTGFQYRWNNVVPGFNMPVRVTVNGAPPVTIKPTGVWQRWTGPLIADATVVVDENYYVLTHRY